LHYPLEIVLSSRQSFFEVLNAQKGLFKGDPYIIGFIAATLFVVLNEKIYMPYNSS
jgi:hypothetical protein